MPLEDMEDDPLPGCSPAVLINQPFDLLASVSLVRSSRPIDEPVEWEGDAGGTPELDGKRQERDAEHHAGLVRGVRRPAVELGSHCVDGPQLAGVFNPSAIISITNHVRTGVSGAIPGDFTE